MISLFLNASKTLLAIAQAASAQSFATSSACSHHDHGILPLVEFNAVKSLNRSNGMNQITDSFLDYFKPSSVTSKGVIFHLEVIGVIW